jgi:hypothetical protein
MYANTQLYHKCNSAILVIYTGYNFHVLSYGSYVISQYINIISVAQQMKGPI